MGSDFTGNAKRTFTFVLCGLQTACRLQLENACKRSAFVARHRASSLKLGELPASRDHPSSTTILLLVTKGIPCCTYLRIFRVVRASVRQRGGRHAINEVKSGKTLLAARYSVVVCSTVKDLPLSLRPYADRRSTLIRGFLSFTSSK